MVDENEPFEIEHGGNAFMMIRRDCFQALEPHTPIYTNGGRSLPDGVEIKDYFRVEINKDTNHLLSEDYFFCHSYRQVGGKVWCAPWVETGHFGYISLMVNTLEQLTKMAQPIVKYTLNKKGQTPEWINAGSSSFAGEHGITGNKTGYIPKYESPQSDTIFLGIASGDPDPDGTPDDYVGTIASKADLTDIYYRNRIDITI